ncbi:PAS domain-containing sensor histidine kinase [Ramlibacter sp. AN1015]|uniref:sensor histidine kinase n=1 Tax=Ramlibacter sp. AN1015 TaxID=3133428 RepID=UPI0030C38351
MDENTIGRAIAQAWSEAVFAKDRAGRYRFANAAALAALGKPAGEVIGHNDHEILGDAAVAAPIVESDRRVLREGLPVETEVAFAAPDGTLQTWWTRKTPLRGERGDVVGLLGMARNVTQRRLDDERLRALSQERQLALDAAGMAWWHFDPRTGISRVDARYASIFGIEGREISAERLFELVHPDDRERAARTVERALDPHDPQPYHLEMRIIRPDGQERWVEAHGIAGFEGAATERAATRFVGTVADITERVRTRHALEETNRKLVLADAQKTQFLTTLSHELRNPLAPMRSAIDLLRLGGGDPAVRGRAATVLARQLQHLTRLVDDLLDLARINRGQISLRNEPLDLRPVVEAAVDAMRPVAEDGGLSLALSLPADAGAEAPTVQGDATRLTQCLINLLGNSVKFTPRGGHVEVRLARNGGRVVCEVEDDGIGISADLLEAVFGAFVQAQPSGAGNQGLGLGLALTRSIVEQHGGSVSASSGGPHAGTCIRIELPAA